MVVQEVAALCDQRGELFQNPDWVALEGPLALLFHVAVRHDYQAASGKGNNGSGELTTVPNGLRIFCRSLQKNLECRLLDLMITPTS